MELRIEVDLAGVRDFARVGQAITRALEQGADDATTLTLREMQTYPGQRPPANPKKPYRRTGTLKRSWQKRIQREGNTVVGMVVSAGQIAPYNVYVQSAERQAWMHRGVWQTERQVVERLRGHILRMYEERLRRNLAELRR